MVPHSKAKQRHSHSFSSVPPLLSSINLLVPTHYPNSPWRLASFPKQRSAQVLLHRSLQALRQPMPLAHTSLQHTWPGTLPSLDLPPFLEVKAQVHEFTRPVHPSSPALPVIPCQNVPFLPLNPPLLHIHSIPWLVINPRHLPLATPLPRTTSAL